jgi:hypothetical protein
MRSIPKLLALASFGHLFGIVYGGNAAIKISGTPPANASAPLPEAFVSYSLELCHSIQCAANADVLRKQFLAEHILQQSSE